MKAEVIYDDLTGTVAADISDHSCLDDYLRKHGVDTKRYKAVRIDFNSGYRSCSASIVCIDKDNSTIEKSRFVRIPLNSISKYEDFFILFKRFKIILIDKFYSDEIFEEEIIN